MLGTAKTVPTWVNEHILYETYGWTERELYEETSELTVVRALALEQEREKARRAKAAMEKSKR